MKIERIELHIFRADFKYKFVYRLFFNISMLFSQFFLLLLLIEFDFVFSINPVILKLKERKTTQNLVKYLVMYRVL